MWSNSCQFAVIATLSYPDHLIILMIWVVLIVLVIWISRIIQIILIILTDHHGDLDQ